MATQFAHKVAIVTGSSSGLGEAIALKLASQGARVTLAGRDQARLKAVLDKAVQVSGGQHDHFLTVAGDLTDTKLQQQLLQQTVAKFGRLDILVANAGMSGDWSSFLGYTEQVYDAVFNTNVKSVFFLIQQAVPHLEKSKGNIVTISSVSSTWVSPAAIPYSMSKAAIDHMTRCLSVELGARGIRVNSVNPGYVPTMFLRQSDATASNLVDKVERQLTPLAGRIASPADVAAAVAYLASDAAGVVTGVHIRVDGGRAFTGSTGADQQK